MKRGIILLVMAAFIASHSVNATGNLSTIGPEATVLSNDAEFVEMINSIFNFSADVYRHKKQDALGRFPVNAASGKDLKDLIEAAGVANINQVYAMFSKINSLKKSVNGRYSFLVNNERGSDIIKEAVIELARDRKLPRFKNIDVDCLASLMGMFGICYWMMEECNIINNNGESGGQENNCVAAVTACLVQAFIASDQCFNLGILPF